MNTTCKSIAAFALLVSTCLANPNRTYKAIEESSKISRAINEILVQYGDEVSVESKAKSLNKFGANLTVGTSFETVAIMQGTTSNETYVSTNLIDSAISTSASDTMTIVLEGHTIDGSGNLTFVSQDVVMTGTTEVTLTTPLARATRAFIKDSGTFDSPQSLPVGTISIYDNTDGETAGTPNTDAATKLILPAGESQTEKASTSISSTDYWIITTVYFDVGVAGGAANRVTYQMQTRDVANGGVWRPLGGRHVVDVDQGGDRIHLGVCEIVPKNHDFRVQAKVDSNTASVLAEVCGPLVKIQ